MQSEWVNSCLRGCQVGQLIPADINYDSMLNELEVGGIEQLTRKRIHLEAPLGSVLDFVLVIGEFIRVIVEQQEGWIVPS